MITNNNQYNCNRGNSPWLWALEEWMLYNGWWHDHATLVQQWDQHLTQNITSYSGTHITPEFLTDGNIIRASCNYRNKQTILLPYQDVTEQDIISYILYCLVQFVSYHYYIITLFPISVPCDQPHYTVPLSHHQNLYHPEHHGTMPGAVKRQS